MFLKPSTLNSLMKQAYKGGLTLGRTEDNWLYIAGDFWEVSVKKDFIPKKTLGDIIALTGELPEPGERFKATKLGNQMEMGMPLKIDNRPFSEDYTLTVTSMLLIGTGRTVQRLLQDMHTGNIYAVNNVFITIVDNGLIDEDRGEYEVIEPFYNPAYGILWENNVCKLRAHFRADEKNEKVLRNLEGVDITPEVPE